MLKYNATRCNEEGEFVIEILEGEFEGVEFTMGGVTFAEEENTDGTLNMSFEYNVVKATPALDNVGAADHLKKVLGDWVLDVLESQIGVGEMVYKGGT